MNRIGHRNGKAVPMSTSSICYDNPILGGYGDCDIGLSRLECAYILPPVRIARNYHINRFASIVNGTNAGHVHIGIVILSGNQYRLILECAQPDNLSSYTASFSDCFNPTKSSSAQPGTGQNFSTSHDSGWMALSNLPIKNNSRAFDRA